MSAGKRQVLHVAALAGGASAKESGAVPEREDHHVGGAGGGHGIGDRVLFPAIKRGTRHVGDSCPREFCGDGLEERGDADSGGCAGVLNANVRGERVAAEYGELKVCSRANDGHAGGLGEWQGAVIGEQDHRLLGDLEGNGAASIRVQGNGAAHGIGVRKVLAGCGCGTG